jgi:Ca-activated chloride channel family protein
MRGADLAATNNIPVFTIGAGSVDGAPIVLSDGTIIKDQSGNTVISSLDESTLQRVAERTGGAYFNLSNPAVAVNLLDSVREINEFSDRKGIRFRNIEHFRFFIILSLIFVFLNYSIRGVKWKKDF